MHAVKEWKMSDTLTLRIESLELIRMAHKHEFEGPYAIVALTAGIYEIAAAIVEYNQLLDLITTDYRRIWERNSDRSKADGRKK
jgi:hypothetical protein